MPDSAGVMDLLRNRYVTISLAGGTIVLWFWHRSRLTRSKPAPYARSERSTRQNYHAQNSTLSPRRSVRLSQVHPEKGETDTDIDIIAIHGLDTNSKMTWTWKDGSNPKIQINWLENPDMLPSKVERVRIFTCDWPADLLQPSNLAQNTMKELALRLLDGIQRRSPATPTNGNHARTEERPILFIASCLGGIILMKALVEAGEEYRSLRRATHGILFLATPFRGTSFRDVAAWAEPGLKAWASIQGRESSKLLDSVKGSTFELESLVRNFTSLCQDKDHPCQVFTFYENGKTSLPSKIFPWLPAWLRQEKQLVDNSSATLDIIQAPLPLDRPHVNMNKFCGPECPDYNCVAGKVKEILGSIREGLLLAEADAWIHNQCYTADRLKIERLSGDLLPMGQCYINLVIVEQPGRDVARSEEGDTAQQSSQFTLSARLEVQQPAEKIKVELSELFGGNDGRARPRRRILIRGRAGVGKTTLCKKIVHDFNNHGAWKGLFDRVLWMPLRRLKTWNPRECNLGELLYNEYFSQSVNGRLLARRLWRTIKYGGNTLFILDGLDEVTEDLHSDPNMSQLLISLLNMPNVVITSRPYGKLPPDLLPLDLELETIGFYLDQVKEYIEKTYPDLDTNKPHSPMASKIQSFLQDRPLIQDLVRIPIQLDALCFTWDEGFRAETMTAIYQAIEYRLWKKDVLRLEKKINGERVTRFYIQYSHLSEIEDLVKDEIYFLEGLAFTGLYNAVINFEARHQYVISRHFELTAATLLDKTLPRLSFLRTSDLRAEHGRQTYHFLHLTFQEYFAARYFVRQWTSGKQLACLRFSCGQEETNAKDVFETLSTEAEEFLQKEKYNARYDIFWRFVAGLLQANNGEEQLCRLFRTIKDEPRDLLGPVHQRLIMHCLSEVDPSQEISKFDLCRKQLRQWLLFECDLEGRSRLAAEMEFPENILEAVLREESEDVQLKVLRSLSARPKISSKEILAAVAARLESPNEHVRRAVAYALRGQSALPAEILAAVAARLEHPESQVRRAAANALGRQSALPAEILAAIAARLEDPESHVRWTAAYTLGWQSALPVEIFAAVAARLGDPESQVRRAAANALGRQSALPTEILTAVAARLGDSEGSIREVAYILDRQLVLPVEILTAIAARLENPDGSVREAAAYALGGQSTLSIEILTAVAARLEDPEGSVREAAADALGRQSALPVEILTVIAARLEHPKGSVRRAAANALGGQSALPAEILAIVTARLEDPERSVRWAAANTLGGQSALPAEILTAVAARLKDPEAFIREAAVYTLGGQLALPTEILAAVMARLEDPGGSVRETAADTLRRQSVLPTEILKTIAARLEHPKGSVREAAVYTLGGQLALPTEILAAVAARLEDPEGSIREAATDILGRQSALSTKILAAITARLGDPKGSVRRAAANALGRQSALPVEIFAAVAARLGDPESHVRWAAADALGRRVTALSDEGFCSFLDRGGQTFNSLYGLWLKRSFKEHVTWYVDGEDYYINLPEGTRNVPLVKFEGAIKQAQALWEVPLDEEGCVSCDG